MMARLFALTVLVYPLALALLCAGAGLLVDRASGAFLPIALVPSVGAATLIGLSQLGTYFAGVARATPYLLAAVALLGFALGRPRLRALLGALRDERGAPRRAYMLAIAVGPIAYLLAIAPVLLAGRASFSSFMALSDSAVHMLGADYLIHHGQHYQRLDLRNSYGQFVADYYATGYPSGADTLYGGSSQLLGLPLIWTFQPFNAFILALASGPAWQLARGLGLRGAAAALAALAATVPALVYASELIGSVKEIVALAMLLCLGALVVTHRSWLARGARRALPFALVLAAGVSSLGVGFGAWGLAAALVLLLTLLGRLRADEVTTRAALATVAAGALALLIAAWPTWRHVSASLHVAQAISATGNAGNLHAPLRWTQAFGVWLRGSYKQSPSGVWSVLTDALIAAALIACALGAANVLLRRRFALAGWIASTVLVWLVLDRSATTWVDAKALVLSSPVVVLLACGGVAALLAPPVGRASSVGEHASPPDAARSARTWRRRAAVRGAGALLGIALLVGVLGSDAALYHGSNLAPTARYEELASVNRRFGASPSGGRRGGPTLFTDFDEYSMYVLRDLDVGGPDFVYPPPALASLAGGYGRPVVVARASSHALRRYRLIVTRRDPSAVSPSAPFVLAWEGVYYQVWVRRNAVSAGGSTVAATARPALPGQASIVRVDVRAAKHPRGWGRVRAGWAMRGEGQLRAGFELPRAGRWTLWLQGQFMPRVIVSVDGRRLATIAGQLAGNSLVPDTATPISLSLGAGAHSLGVARGGFSLAPGNGGSAVLAGAFFTPGVPPREAAGGAGVGR
ncbi:MAG: hypothetical protein QOF54_1865 [Solirubrobacteraceae bacterium]|jgi:hypothetical protein|nr:hypothetical protein [Solirubrobacteraceae bacterium]